MPEPGPTGFDREAFHFLKRKRPANGKPPIKFRHWIAENGRRQNIDTKQPAKRSLEVGDQDAPLTQTLQSSQNFHCLRPTEVVKSQRTQYQVEPLTGVERADITLYIRDLRKSIGTSASDIQSRRLHVHREHLHLRTLLSRPLHDQSGNIAKTGTCIQNGQFFARLEPTLKEMPNSPMTAEMLIQPLEIYQSPNQFRSGWIRAIHQLQKV